ncbi:MAG: hypothetical protein I3J03_00280 [Actinomyces succiniciruminis]|uniref:Uncharacterized protein n=1 Tax=Actinomyces succiniciruminis TaxID=1522002 RepID=A0A1L7RCI9_9ACTO|nr:hypothetical protein [Actinomyces succiniciruminis]MBM6978147.1 hypothetical protein [Actinomyces succiniciruminis]CED91631.1 Hypothetical protein AAM4_1799 [Actinomyces succiniciruminis]
MTIEILTAIAGSLVTGVVAFLVSRRRYRNFLMARAAVGGTITDAGLLSTLRTIIQAITVAGACAVLGASLLIVARQLLDPLQVASTCGVIAVLAVALAWVYGRYAVLAELARIRHLELPYGPWGVLLANGHL